MQLFGRMRKDSRAEALKKHILFEGNFNKDIKRLYSLGRSSDVSSSLEALPENFRFDEKLWDKLHNLHRLLGAWEDSGLSRGNEENKKQRHALKYKKDLAKPIRRTIRKALEIEVIKLAEVLETANNSKTNVTELNKQLTAVKNAVGKISGSQLIALTSECIRLLKTINPELKSPKDKDLEKRFKKAASAITSFKTFPQKILASLSVSVAVIAALACGFFTGGFIYVLLVGSFGVAAGVAIGVAALAGLFGFTVNVRFFSKSLPEFLLKLINPSRITEFVNEKGKRVQFSNLKKYVYLPLAALFSVAVGFAFAAFSMAQFAAILMALPFLAATGPLPLILALVLAVTMIIVMFKAFVEIAPKLSFSQLWQSLKTAWKGMTLGKFLSYGITLAVCGMGIFGLFMACHAGFGTLVNYFGGPAAILVLVTSFAGQLPFNVLTVSTFCKVMGSFLLSIPNKLMGIPEKLKNLFRQTPTQSGEVLEKSSFVNKMTSAGRYIWESIIIPVLLFVNAIANGAGVMLGKPSTAEYVAGAAGALNSMSGNLVSDSSIQERSEADKAAIENLKTALNTQVVIPDTQQDTQAVTQESAPEVSNGDKRLTDSEIEAIYREAIYRNPSKDNRRPSNLPFFHDQDGCGSSGQPSPSSWSPEDSDSGGQEQPISESLSKVG